MKRTAIALLAGCSLIAGVSIAAAQDGRIVNGNNPAKRASTIAPAARGAEMPSKITNSNNPAPNYPVAGASAKPANKHGAGQRIEPRRRDAARFPAPDAPARGLSAQGLVRSAAGGFPAL